jgi:hypothetical protein
MSAVLALPTIAAAPASSEQRAGLVENFTVDASGKVIRGVPTPVGCPEGYSYMNEDPSFALVSAPQNGEEWADDIHMGIGRVVGFGAGFVRPDPAFSGAGSDSFDVTLTLYQWQGDDMSPGSAIVGPFTVRVPSNAIGVGFGFSPGPVVGPNVWLGASFSDPGVGMVLHNPPQQGTSHDLYWNMTTDMQGQLSGVGVANFVASVTVCRLRAAAVGD